MVGTGADKTKSFPAENPVAEGNPVKEIKKLADIFPIMNKYINPKNYFKAITNCGPSILSPFIKIFEKEKVEYFGNMPLKHDPLFIIGAPRTGSTILYQSLTNLYDVLYIDNFGCKFHRNFFFGLWLSNKIYADQPHNNYDSEHGDTSMHGMHTPSECGQFWYRWLPKEHHFIDYDEIADEMIKQIKKEVSAVINYFDKPILIKNLNVGQRLRLIWKCFPNAKFLYIKRDPFFVVQSILKARSQKNIPHNQIWSIKPPNYKSLLSLDEVSMVTAQVYYLERQIEKDLSLFDKKNVFTFNYESMTTNFTDFLSNLEQRLNFPQINKYEIKETLPDITLNNRVTVNKELERKINKALKTFRWNRDHFETEVS